MAQGIPGPEEEVRRTTGRDAHPFTSSVLGTCNAIDHVRHMNVLDRRCCYLPRSSYGLVLNLLPLGLCLQLHNGAAPVGGDYDTVSVASALLHVPAGLEGVLDR